MSPNYVVEKLGRRLRLGVVGGGPGSFMGSIHRAAALMNEQYDVVASVLSSNPERSIEAAQKLGITRGYASALEMIEAESKRDDGIDVIAIMTPNNSHYQIACQALDHGLHVICEKPLTNVLSQAQDLQRRVAKSGLHFCVTYGYSGYPMVRQAKAMVDAGDLGEIRMVQCNYVQGHLAQLNEAEKNDSNWHMDPEVAGGDLVVGDIGTHCYHLSNFVSGMLPERLSADTTTLVPGRKATDYTNIQLRYANGARGSFLVTQAAAGAAHGLYLRVFGSKGGLEWHQEQPNELLYRRLDAPAQLLTKGGPGLYESANRASRVSIGHPEGYQEGFATLYADFAKSIVASTPTDAAPSAAPLYPGISEGVEGVRFIETAIESNRGDGAWVTLESKCSFACN
ncbi:MAG: Gfo/Idh/MocA family oxidoreductase [Motiliproteus sp.]